MKRTVLATMLLGLAVLPAAPSTALAQQAAAAQPAAARAAEVREVYPRDLMTFRERFDMWRAMRAAKTPEEKMDLWAAKYAELEKRAAEKGVRLKEMGPMMMQNGHQENGGQKWNGERRMGMTGQGSGSMHARPPMAP